MNCSNAFKRRIRKLYDAETGHRIRTLKALRDGHNLIAGGTEPLKKLQYPVQNIISAHEIVRKKPEVWEDSYHIISYCFNSF